MHSSTVKRLTQTISTHAHALAVMYGNSSVTVSSTMASVATNMTSMICGRVGSSGRQQRVATAAAVAAVAAVVVAVTVAVAVAVAAAAAAAVAAAVAAAAAAVVVAAAESVGYRWLQVWCLCGSGWVARTIILNGLDGSMTCCLKNSRHRPHIPQCPVSVNTASFADCQCLITSLRSSLLTTLDRSSVVLGAALGARSAGLSSLNGSTVDTSASAAAAGATLDTLGELEKTHLVLRVWLDEPLGILWGRLRDAAEFVPGDDVQAWN